MVGRPCGGADGAEAKKVGLAALRSGSARKAVACLKEAVRTLDESDLEARLYLVDALSADGQRRAAKRALDEVMSSHPTSPYGLFKSGGCGFP